MVTQRVIDEAYLAWLGQFDTHAWEPLPVAVMAQDSCHVLTFQETLLHFLAVDDLESLVQLLVTDAEQFDSLEEVIAEPAIELLLDVDNLFFWFLRKRAGEILTHNTPAVLDDVIHHEVLEVGNAIEQPERQQRYCIKQRINNLCHKSYDLHLIIYKQECYLTFNIQHLTLYYTCCISCNFL